MIYLPEIFDRIRWLVKMDFISFMLDFELLFSIKNYFYLWRFVFGDVL